MGLRILAGIALLLLANLISAQPSHSFNKASNNGFIENKGQIIDQNNNLNPDVLYLLNTPGMNVQLRRGGWSYDLFEIRHEGMKALRHEATAMRQEGEDQGLGYRAQKPELRAQSSVNNNQDPASSIQHPASSIQHPASSIQYHRIDFDLIGANPSCQIITSEPSEDYLNYYTTETPVEGVCFVRYYQQVLFQDIYPNVDLEFIIDDTLGFKYNFIVHPEGKVADIRISITGPEIEETSSGSLLLTTTLGTINEEVPHSYLQTDDFRRGISIRFKSKGQGVYGFLSKEITDNESTLIIDPHPTRIWGTYYGGSDQEGAWGCSADGFGNVFIAGNTHSLTYIATAGSHQPTIGSTYSPDVFLVKFNDSGQRIWGTYYGGTSADQGGSACPTDNAGNIYLVGNTYSSTNISTTAAYQQTYAGGRDAFLVKFNTNGLRIWGTYYGGSGQEDAPSCSVDEDCNVYFGGNTGSQNGISTPGAYQTNFGGGFLDGYIAKFDSSGQSLWGTYYGGMEIDQIRSVSTDTNGYLLTAGTTFSTENIASPSAFQNTSGGELDAFLALFTEGGERIWGTYYGGDTTEWSASCVITDQEKIYLMGSTWSTNNISTAGSYQPVKNDSSDAFLAKFNLDGTREWGTYYGGDGVDVARSGLAVSDSGYIYFSGQTSSLNHIASPGSFLTAFQGGLEDAFIAKFDDNGQRLWGTYFGGPDRDTDGGIALDYCGIIYLSGASQSDTNIATPGAHQIINNHGINYGDGFLTRFSDCEIPDTAEAISGQEYVCAFATGVIYSVPLIGNASDYTWDVPTGVSIISGQNTNAITVNFTSSAVSGTFTVFGKNCCGDGIGSSLFVTIHPHPVPAISGSDSACLGMPYLYFTESGNTLYQWEVSPSNTIISGGTVSDSSVTIVWNDSGSQWISVNYTDSNNCDALIPSQFDIWVEAGDTMNVDIHATEDTICAGSIVSFIANTINAGANPLFQWFINGVDMSQNDSTLTYIPFQTDTVYCMVTSFEPCRSNNPDTSNVLVIYVLPILPVSVTVTPSENPVCEGDSLTFTATPVNGGSSPSFQWKINGINAGTNNPVFSFIPQIGDSVRCILTSNETCTTNNPASSIQHPASVNPLLPVSITISPSVNPVCGGLPVTFTGAAMNGGSTPAFQWQVNGINAGMNNAVFTYTPENGDIVSCVLTSSEPCTSGNPAAGNPVIMTVVEAPEVLFTRCFDTITTTNAKPIKLKGGIPLEGTYSGSGVSNGYFYPLLAGPGMHVITYTYTNIGNCSDAGSLILDVRLTSPFSCGNPLIDIRDSSVYPTIQIGTQCWLAADLAFGNEIQYSTPQRDNCIPEKYSSHQSPVTSHSFYQWDELMKYEDIEEIQGFCPPGWHIPSESDWNALFATWTNSAFAGEPLKYTGYSGFNAFLNGAGFFNQGWWFGDFATFFWSSTSHGPFKAWAHGMNDTNYSVSYYPSYRGNAFSVRCLKN